MKFQGGGVVKKSQSPDFRSPEVGISEYIRQGMIELVLPRLHDKLKLDFHSLNLLNQGVFGIKIF